MARSSAEMEMTGGKSPRQRVWDVIRKCPAAIDPRNIKTAAAVSESVVRDYLRALSNGGYIEVVTEAHVNKLCVRRIYRLVRDCGVEAPRLTKSGEEVKQGSVNEAMWSTLRRMFKAESVDYRQLAAFASTKLNPVPEGTAKAYVLALAAAGYLECVQPANNGRNSAAARYRLRAEMESGRRAPMIQRTKTVFDPNWNKVVWAEKVEISDE